MNIHLLSVFQWHFRGICCEGRTHYVTDSPTGCVKLISPLDGAVEFLTHLGDLFRNFGIHLRGQSGMDSTLVDAQTCLQGVTRFLKRHVSDVQVQIASERITNGPEGTKITRLLEASEFMSPDASNAIQLQSLLTLVVENLQATTKVKQPAPIKVC